MKILVTGAGGFIGENVCREFSQSGHQVVGIDLKYSKKQNSENITGYRQEIADFRNKDKMKILIEKTDVVIHLASAHLQVSLEKKEYWDINVHSLKPFLRLAKENGVAKFIHVSSVGVYGNLQNWPADEDSVCVPQSIYGETKLAGEKEVLDFASETNFPVVIIRPAWVYDEGCPRTKKIYSMLKKRRFFMIGKGGNLRHPVYINDLIDSFRLAMEKEEAIGEIFLIGGDQVITTKDLVNQFKSVFNISGGYLQIPYWMGVMIASFSEIIFGLISKEPPISKRSLEFFNTNNSFSIGKAKRILGFYPKYSFQNGLKSTRNWLLTSTLES